MSASVNETLSGAAIDVAMAEIRSYLWVGDCAEEMLESRICDIMDAIFQEVKDVGNSQSAVVNELRSYPVKHHGGSGETWETLYSMQLHRTPIGCCEILLRATPSRSVSIEIAHRPGRWQTKVTGSVERLTAEVVAAVKDEAVKNAWRRLHSDLAREREKRRDDDNSSGGSTRGVTSVAPSTVTAATDLESDST